MTYDFSGAFSQKTGYNSNLHKTADTQFSVEDAVTALEKFIPSQQIKIGIPAYERAAIADISSDNGGLGQAIDPTKNMVLPGDLDKVATTVDQGNNDGYYCY